MQLSLSQSITDVSAPQFCASDNAEDSLSVGPRLVSESSGGPPSAYQQRKRVRLSSSPNATPAHSRPGSAQYASNNMGSITDRTNAPVSPAVRALSRAGSNRDGSTRSLRQSIVSSIAPSPPESRRGSRRSPSQTSIPVAAVMTPHPPSLSRSSIYHMRDPRRPPRVHPTPWVPRLRSADEEGSPLHAWIFFIGFILFPLWWIASFLPIPETRRVGYTDTEKGVTVDDPQVEHGMSALLYVRPRRVHTSPQTRGPGGSAAASRPRSHSSLTSPSSSSSRSSPRDNILPPPRAPISGAHTPALPATTTCTRFHPLSHRPHWSSVFQPLVVVIIVSALVATRTSLFLLLALCV